MVATLKTGVIQEPSSGTANLTLDASGGVTVGQNLTVAGTTTFTGGSTFTGNATAAAFIPSGSTVPTNGLYRPAANTVGLATNSTNALYIDSSQNVGIGTTSPNSKLEVTGRITASDGGGASRVALNIESNTTAQSYSGINSYNYGTSTARSLVLNESGGSVGIGIITPSSYGTLVVSAANSFTGITTGDFSTVANNAGIYIRSTGSAGISWANGGSLNFYRGGPGSLLSATIDSSGSLLVGTTNASSSAGNGVKILPRGNVSVVNDGSTGGGDGFDFYNSTAAAYRFYVTGAGVINATSTTITAISDQRLKENIKDIDVGLDAVMALKPRKFDWKKGKGKDKKGDRGWIAQEFEQVFPDMISTWKDEPPEGEEPYKAVNADLIPVLVKAIQELTAKVTALEAKVGA